MKKLLSLTLLLQLVCLINAQEMKFNCMESHTYNTETKQYEYHDLFSDDITINFEEDKITYYSAVMDERMIWTIIKKEVKDGSTFYNCTDNEKELTVIENPDYPGLIYAFGDIKNYLMNCKE